MIEIKEIKKFFKNKKIFDKLDFKFEEGNIYHIKGQNGCGKSVLLKIICGFSIPDNGEVIIDGKKLGEKMDFIDNAGVSINNDEFISYLSGYDNLKLLLDIRKKVSEEVINKYAEIFDLKEDIQGKPYRLYSQGMKQKLRLIQAFMEDPKYLILDEPTNALDKKAIQALYDHIKKFMSKKDKTVIFVTHSDDIISSLADVVIEIEDGKLKEVDTSNISLINTEDDL